MTVGRYTGHTLPAPYCSRGHDQHLYSHLLAQVGHRAEHRARQTQLIPGESRLPQHVDYAAVVPCNHVESEGSNRLADLQGAVQHALRLLAVEETLGQVGQPFER